MTQQVPVQQYPAPEQRPGNGLGLTGFVLGLVGAVLAVIPLIGVVAWPLVILGIVFAAVGLAKSIRKNATGKGLSIAGLALSVIGLALCVLWATVVNKTVDDVDQEAHRTITVTYEVSGTAKNVEVDYSTYGDKVESKQETVAKLPWQKDVKTHGLVKGGSLIVTTGESGGNVSCRVIVDGKEAAKSTVSGAFEVADCTGF